MAIDVKPARILVVDDHPIVRLGIRQMLAGEPDLVITAESESADGALQTIRGVGYILKDLTA